MSVDLHCFYNVDAGNQDQHTTLRWSRLSSRVSGESLFIPEDIFFIALLFRSRILWDLSQHPSSVNLEALKTVSSSVWSYFTCWDLSAISARLIYEVFDIKYVLFLFKLSLDFHWVK